MIRISTEQLDLIKGTISKYFPDRPLMAFIERRGEMPVLAPELDLVLMGDEVPDEGLYERMKEELIKASFDFGIDICVWAKLTEDLREMLYPRIKSI